MWYFGQYLRGSDFHYRVSYVLNRLSHEYLLGWVIELNIYETKEWNNYTSKVIVSSIHVSLYYSIFLETTLYMKLSTEKWPHKLTSICWYVKASLNWEIHNIVIKTITSAFVFANCNNMFHLDNTLWKSLCLFSWLTCQLSKFDDISQY